VIALWEFASLWWFFLKSKGLVPCCELFFFHTFSFFSTPDPSPFSRSWSSISFHLCLVLSIISLSCVIKPFRMLFMHTTCFQSSLHTFLILFVHFLCTLGIFDLHCTRSMCTLCTLGVFDPCCMLFMYAK